jgi:hypothetical protein
MLVVIVTVIVVPLVPVLVTPKPDISPETLVEATDANDDL